MMEKPKIVVNAQSLRESRTVSTTLAATDLHHASSQPPKPKSLSLSLSNSNSADPSPSTLMKKKVKNRSIESPCQATKLKHKFDELQEMHSRRNKSCGEGIEYAPSDEFDLWWAKPSAVEHKHVKMHHNSFSKPEAIRESFVSGKDDVVVETCEDDEGFKCSALCLYLSGFWKAKAVKTRKEGTEIMEGGVGVISRTVSLEKFECGSWASSALFHETEGDSMSSSYFDLPMELIKCSANDDVHVPVTSAFVFDKDLKGVLKAGSSGKSSHHVRFSASSSTSKPASPASCITPRGRKAREDFTSFLEAQIA